MIGKLRIRFHVKIDSDNHKEFDFNQKTYTAITYPSFITLENMNNTNQNDSTKSIMITEKNIFSLITALNSMKNKLYNENLYIIENKKLVLLNDVAVKNTVTTQLYGGGIIAMKPSIVYDENDNQYEGVTLFINNTGNAIDLTIDELEAVLYCVTKVDFFTYSQLIINYFIYYYKVDTDNSHPVTTSSANSKYTNKPNIDWSSEPKTVANFKKGEDEFSKLLNPHND